MRSATINPVNAPTHPPILFKGLKRRNKPNKTALAGQKIARKNNGRPNIPIKAQTKITTATIENAEIFCLNP